MSLKLCFLQLPLLQAEFIIFPLFSGYIVNRMIQLPSVLIRHWRMYEFYSVTCWACESSNYLHLKLCCRHGSAQCAEGAIPPAFCLLCPCSAHTQRLTETAKPVHRPFFRLRGRVEFMLLIIYLLIENVQTVVN